VFGKPLESRLLALVQVIGFWGLFDYEHEDEDEDEAPSTVVCAGF